MESDNLTFDELRLAISGFDYMAAAARADGRALDALEYDDEAYQLSLLLFEAREHRDEMESMFGRSLEHQILELTRSELLAKLETLFIRSDLVSASTDVLRNVLRDSVEDGNIDRWWLGAI